MADDAPTVAVPDSSRVVSIARHGGVALFAVLDASEYIQSHHAAGRFYENDLLDALRDSVGQGDLVLDVGANIGNHTVYLAAICGCQVVAIEPQPENFAHLQRNVALNQLEERVTLLHAAAGDASGLFAAPAVRDPGNSGSVTVEVANADTGIPVIRLDDLALPAPPKLIKIDTEGMELPVLRGASRLLAEHHPLVAVEAQSIDEYDAIAAFLKQFSYVCRDARNVTPTFLFAYWEVAPESLEIVDALTAECAHQRITLSSEIARLNLRVRRANEVYARSKELLATSEAKRKELEGRLADPLREVASLKAALTRMDADNSRLVELLDAHRQWLTDAKANERELRTTLARTEASLEDSQAKGRKLSADLAKASAERERAARNYRTAARELDKIRSSESYRVGHAIIMAFTRPGRNTLLLPWRLFRAIFRRGRGRAPKPVLSGTAASAAAVTEGPSAPSVVIPQVPDAGPRRRRARAVAPRAIDVSRVSDLRVACIMDEFTFASYDPECHLLQITPERWEEEITSFDPHLLFVESAWRGVDGLWDRKISHASPELLALVEWCRDRGIQTVFWNKEDPVHFETFIGIAKLFDHVFTTDIDCLARYRTVLDSSQAHLLLFACQPRLHNPLEVYQRKEAFCFAGAYYTRYPERTVDLEAFVTTLSTIGPVEIYDRNFYGDNPDYMFPDTYRPYIIGHLPVAEIDRAYKGYRYGINLNSIKHSQTMFARRVFELLASNTIVVSNFSRGMRLLFGDLVVSTDNGLRLHQEVAQLFADDLHYRKLRLAGLRKALTEHTYGDRLAYVAEVALGIPRPDPLPAVTITALAGDDREMEAILRAFRRQRYLRTRLLLVLRDGYAPATPPADAECRLLPWDDAMSAGLGDLVAEGFVAGMVPADYYGANYLYDLVLGSRYSNAPAIGKRCAYHHVQGEFRKEEEGQQYRLVEALPLRAAIVGAEQLAGRRLAEWVAELPAGEVRGLECLAADEFNYCQDYAGESCPLVDDLPIADDGRTLADLEAVAASIEPDPDAFHARQFSGKDLFALLGTSAPPGVTLTADGRDLRITADLAERDYLYAPEPLPLAQLGFEKEARLYFDVTPGLDVRVVLVFLNGRRKPLGSLIAVGNRNYREAIPEGTASVRIGLRVAGAGTCTAGALVLGNVTVGTSTFVGHSDVLVLANRYPQYDDLYRYAFLHRRVVEYRRAGRLVDVFRMNADRPGGYYEFMGIGVACGYQDELRQLLAAGRHRTVLVHFLEPAMWEVLRDYVDRLRLIVWVHGAEVQPWQRREYNLTTPEERRRAIEASDQRMAFWRGLFGELHPHLHFVFVSQYLADQAMEDVGIPLPPAGFSVIHNVIDTDLFAYHAKDPELRKKVLSIRPYVNKTYANDLMVKAILELSRQPFFGELTFRLIGDGPLFESTVAPLRAFPNVTLEKGFLRQEEIVSLHRKYGVLLVPTRMDTQGVSRDEAMASGLVPVTNRVAAIPEFVDEHCGILADPEDYLGLAAGLARLYRDPELFLRLSQAAAARVRRQSGREQTITRELALFAGVGQATG